MTKPRKKGPGRPMHPLRVNIVAKFGRRRVSHDYRIPLGLCEQLERCADDMARRILLGVTEKKEQ